MRTGLALPAEIVKILLPSISRKGQKMKKILSVFLFIPVFFTASVLAQIPVNTLVQISKAEDELRYDKTLESLMKNADAQIRARASLAAGRIGDQDAIPALTVLLQNDKEAKTRATAAFALGEIESIKAADAILSVLKNNESADAVRARAIEAAGKIAASNAKDDKSKQLGEAILDVLEKEDLRGKQQSKEIVLLGITAALRARPEGADFVVAKFLTNLDARVRADAANTLARIRAKTANEKLRAMLLSDDDPIARANAARALGAAEDKDSLDLLLEAAVSDEDSRVRVSAIRSVGSLKEAKTAGKLLERGEKLLSDYKKSKFGNPVEKNELLEIATVLGRILDKSKNERAIILLDQIIKLDNLRSVDFAVARIKISQQTFREFYAVKPIQNTSDNWQTSTLFQLFGEFPAFEETEEAKKIKSEAEKIVRFSLTEVIGNKKVNSNPIEATALPNLLRSFAAFKSNDLPEVLQKYLRHYDPFVRAAAAELLGEQSVTKENVEALKTAFAESLKTDKDYNDAQLAILSAVVKLDKPQSFESLRLALTAPDYLVRRHAANLIKQNDLMKDFSNIEKQVGTVKIYDPETGTRLGQVLNSQADYKRAVSRKNGMIKAVLATEKGTLTIDLLPEDAPLTVDNFIKLAKSGYFNGIAIHRVVPNFVIQDGDPRGDGNGGPAWSIRDEINTVPYERGTVGMALSGPHTGGSQWFVTHSPQPHLDGGYTVFGRVNETDMKIVDSIVRGDKILSVKIVEGKSPQRRQKPAR